MYDTSKPYKNRVLSLIRQTWRENPYILVQRGADTFFERKQNDATWDMDHTDGIGTKGLHHWNQRTFYCAVLDALAMNINDLAMCRAIPYKTQCHLMLPQEDIPAIFEIMENLVEECQTRNIVITGGETSIQENLSGMELSLTMTGNVQIGKKNLAQNGDVVVGFASNGIHSNGLTRAREALGNKENRYFTVPTRIYLEKIKPLFEKANSLMHITGGAFTRLKNILPRDLDIQLNSLDSLRPHGIFWDLHEKISDDEMYRTFNCGVGFVITLPPEDAKNILSSGDISIIGTVNQGTGDVHVKSAFTGETITF